MLDYFMINSQGRRLIRIYSKMFQERLDRAPCIKSLVVAGIFFVSTEFSTLISRILKMLDLQSCVQTVFSFCYFFIRIFDFLKYTLFLYILGLTLQYFL